LSFVATDLEREAGWSDAVAGCDYVLHVASPFPPGTPKHEDDLIVPARDGTLRVLRASRDAGVKRVVMTSSFAAVGYGHPQQAKPFDDTDWTDPTHDDATAYVKSKTIAERAAWDFVKREGGGLELTTINPVGIFGPVLGPDYSSSINLVKRMLDGGMSKCPELYFGVVDVRDVADLHIRAISNPAAKGERFLATAGDFISMVQIAHLVGVEATQLPNEAVRAAAQRDPALAQTLPELGKVKNATSAKARRLLGWNPRTTEQTLNATVESLRRFGLVKT
jgi:dihydroflavonol-4-reductase